MVFVSIGGVKVRGLHRLPRFFLLTFRAQKAALAADGCIKVDLFREGRTFFAVSTWATRDTMKSFAHTGAHRALMAEAKTLFHFTRNTTLEANAPLTSDEAKAAWKKAFPKP